MKSNATKTWHLPLSPEAKASNLLDIQERHAMMLAMGPQAWALQGRKAKKEDYKKPTSERR